MNFDAQICLSLILLVAATQHQSLATPPSWPRLPLTGTFLIEDRPMCKQSLDSRQTPSRPDSCTTPIAHVSCPCHLCGGSLGATSTLRCALLETVAELAGDELEGAHATGTGGLSPLSLLAPVVCRGYVSTRAGSVEGPEIRVGRSFRKKELVWCIWVVSRTLSDARAGVSAVGAGVLLHVHRAAACWSQSQSAFIRRMSHPSGPNSLCFFSSHFLPPGSRSSRFIGD